MGIKNILQQFSDFPQLPLKNYNHTNSLQCRVGRDSIYRLIISPTLGIEPAPHIVWSSKHNYLNRVTRECEIKMLEKRWKQVEYHEKLLPRIFEIHEVCHREIIGGD